MPSASASPRCLEGQQEEQDEQSPGTEVALALGWHWAQAAWTLKISPVPVPVLVTWKVSRRTAMNRRVLNGISTSQL